MAHPDSAIGGAMRKEIYNGHSEFKNGTLG
jgi:hypothetical protein